MAAANQERKTRSGRELVATGRSTATLVLKRKGKRADQVRAFLGSVDKDILDRAIASTEDVRGDEEVLAKYRLSDGTVDSYNSTIDPHGWELSDYRNNPVVLFSHDSRSLPVGQDIGAHVVKGDDAHLAGVCRFASAETDPFAAKVARFVSTNLLRAVSVGFEPREFEFNMERDDPSSMWLPVDYKRQALREYSPVTVPANASALLQESALSAVGLRLADGLEILERLLEDHGSIVIPRAELESLRKEVRGSKLVIDLGEGAGSFALSAVDADADHDHERADLTCPECGYVGPSSAFGGGSVDDEEKAAPDEDEEDKKDEDDSEEGEAVVEDSSPGVYARGSRDTNDDFEDDAPDGLSELASVLADAIEDRELGRLP